MGLDQYAQWVNPTNLIDADAQVDLKFNEGVEYEEFHYWRKHPDMQGWMQQLYVSKGGSDPEFNCARVRLTSEDLEKLQKDLLAGKLPATAGFFFGRSEPEDIEDDLAFVAKALYHLYTGRVVYYTSWW